MRTDGYWLHDGVVRCVSVRCLGKNFHQCVQCCEEDVPSSMVTMKAFDLAPSFCCILLGIWSELVEQSVLHSAMTFVVGGLIFWMALSRPVMMDCDRKA